MLVCFGCAWPFSIHKSYTSRDVSGKSILFLWVILVGYCMGVLHKFYYHYDVVIFLYMLNGCMVLVDIMLYYRNRKLAKVKVLPFGVTLRG